MFITKKIIQIQTIRMSHQNSSRFLSLAKKDNIPETNSKTLKRTLCVNIEGSLQSLSRQGTSAALWKAVNGRESILFHPNLEENMNSEQNNDVINSLRNGIIKRITVKEHQCTFPFMLGVDISCISPNEVTNLGEKWAYTILPNSSSNQPQVVYECDAKTNDNSNWHNLYAAWNGSNLETHGVMDVPNQPFLFVHMDHPVIGLLRFNQNLLGCDIDSQPKLEKEYFKVSKQVMAHCCQTIREDVLNKMKTKDLNLFTLQLRRLNNTPWAELDSNALSGFKYNPVLEKQDVQAQQDKFLREYTSKPYQYLARLEVEYELPEVSS